jgi:hypothetical protein
VSARLMQRGTSKRAEQLQCEVHPSPFRRIFSIGRPFASSSISLSR